MQLTKMYTNTCMWSVLPSEALNLDEASTEKMCFSVKSGILVGPSSNQNMVLDLWL